LVDARDDVALVEVERVGELLLRAGPEVAQGGQDAVVN
jgi:hypothetical protein